MTSGDFEIVEADLSDPVDARDLVEMIDTYARDPMGAGEPLSERVRAEMVPGLRDHPSCFVLLAREDGRAIGAAVCFIGFSSFVARPLVNVHDLSVVKERRGQGVGRRLLASVEQRARQLQCCRLTLEVMEENAPARGLYETFGFDDPDLGAGTEPVRFLSKRLE